MRVDGCVGSLSAWWGCRARASAALLTMLACGAQVPPPDRIAEVGGEPISHSRFEAFLKRNSIADVGVLTSDVLSALLDQFLDQQLLVSLAEEQYGIEPNANDRSVIEELMALEPVEVDAPAIAIFYRQNLSLFELPERLELRQILFSDRELAGRVREQWAAGTPYRSLMEQLADEPAARVGQEGEVLLEELPSSVAGVLSKLDDGEVSQVQDADYGFHVFQVVRHLPAGIAPLTEVAGTIEAELGARQSAATVERFVTEARERYNVRVFERNLPFNYLGRYRSHETNQTSS